MNRVLHLRSGHGLYGAERALLALAAATRAPFEALVGSIHRGPSDPLADAARQRGVPTFSLLSERAMDLACAREIAEICRAHDVALLHAHDFKALTAAVLATSRVDVPVVATFHGETDASLKLRAYEAFGRMLGNGTRGVAAVSRPLAERLRRWIRTAPVEFIPNGIELASPLSPDERVAARRELGIDAGERVLACIGRLSSEKGQAVLLTALRKLAAPPRVIFVGDGPDREPLQREAVGLPVQFTGYATDARRIYAAADAIVLPSLTEGLPMVALEAGMFERPLIATRVGELPWLFAADADCLVPPGDAVALARAIASFIDGPEAWDGRARRFATRVRDRHSADAMASAYAERLYCRALATASTRITAPSADRSEAGRPSRSRAAP